MIAQTLRRIRTCAAETPGDVFLTYGCVAYLVSILLVEVLIGPPFGWLWAVGWVLAMPISLIIAVVSIIRRGRYSLRLPPLLVLLGLQALLWITPMRLYCEYMHIGLRVYAAGGPEALTAWAQPLIEEERLNSVQDEATPVHVDVPPRIRRGLPGFVSLGGTIWSDTPRLRIELGGGFHHYGVVVYPKNVVTESRWFHDLLDWPPEVVVYTESDD